MRVRARQAPVSGAVSIAIVATARLARDARHARRVACVHIPPRPETMLLVPPAAVAPQPVAAPEPVAAAVLAPEPVTVVLAPPAAAPKSEAAVLAPPAAAPEPEAVVLPPPAVAPEPEAASAPTPAPTAAPKPVAAPPPAPPFQPAPPPQPQPMTATTHPVASAAWGWSEPWTFEMPAVPATFARPPAPPARRPARYASRHRAWRWPLLASLVIIAAAVTVWIAAPWSASTTAPRAATPRPAFTPHPSAFALRTIPVAYLHEYWRVAREYNLDWTKLAAVGQIESDHGRSGAAGVSVGTNAAGAAGPAQFIASTWARYGVDADGQGAMNPYDPADAITAMAAYLKASGAPLHWHRALYTYNHSMAYVRAVLALSRRYLAR